MADAAELAQRLDKARTSITAIPQLSDDVPDLDLETGDAVQRLLREGRGGLVGWKLGVTSRTAALAATSRNGIARLDSAKSGTGD